MKFADFYRVEINDVHFISHQIKELCSDFALTFNRLTRRYEIFDKRRGWVVASTGEYPDRRLIAKAQFQLTHDAATCAREIEKSNAALKQAAQAKLLESSFNKLNAVMSYAASRPSREMNRQDIRKIIM